MVVEIFTRQLERGLAGHRAVAIIGGRRGRRHVVEQAVILVEGLEEDGLAPHFGIGGERVEHVGGEGRPFDRGRGAGMFRAFLGRQDPGYCR